MKLDTLKSTFESARGKMIAGSLAAMVALSPMAMATPSYAEDSKPPTKVAQSLQATSPQAHGQLMFADIRGRDEQFVKHAPGSASSGRVSVVVYGGSDPILRAVYEAAQDYAASGPGRDIYFLQADDNDEDPSTVHIAVWSDGWEYAGIDVENADHARSADFADLTSRAKRHMDGARSEHLAQLSEPQVASADFN